MPTSTSVAVNGFCGGVRPCVVQPLVPGAPVRSAMYSLATPLPRMSPKWVVETKVVAEPSAAARVRRLIGMISPPFLSGGETISQARLSGRKPWPG